MARDELLFDPAAALESAGKKVRVWGADDVAIGVTFSVETGSRAADVT
jgi:hypothetical protein